MSATTSTTLVVNPSAGRGRARRLIPRVEQRLVDAGLPVTTIRTRSYADARAACQEAVAAGTRALFVMGGDGMAHAGLNACARTAVPLGVIPAGTGNDFSRGFGLPTRWDEALSSIVGGRIRRVDLTEVRGEGLLHEPRTYVGSVVSTGFDEVVNWRTNQLSFSIGAPSYAWSVLSELRHFRPLNYRINVDGETRVLSSMLIAVCTGGVFGGGIRIAPEADVTDGLLDLTIIHPVRRRTLLALFGKLHSGRFVSHPAVERLRAVSARIDGDGLHGMADGEVLGRPPFDCVAAPGALLLYSPGPAQGRS